MPDMTNLGGSTRPPTWFEREHMRRLREQGVSDVLLAPEQTPQSFWEVVLQATEHYLCSRGATDAWRRWADELAWSLGVPRISDGYEAYVRAVREGEIWVDTNFVDAGLPLRLAAVEHLIDVAGSYDEFPDAVNDRARWFRVGLRLERARFVPVTEEHAHTELVQPALLLLSAPRFEPVDQLYRKAFDRALGADASGAVTAASSAVEEMLRLGLGVQGSDLSQLVSKARNAGWLAPSVSTIIPKMMALREDSDAHRAGTTDFEVAMFAIHLASTILLFLSKTQPFA